MKFGMSLFHSILLQCHTISFPKFGHKKHERCLKLWDAKDAICDSKINYGNVTQSSFRRCFL